MHKIFVLCLFLVALSGCAFIHQEPIKRNHRPSTAPVFSGWGVENCKLWYRQNDMSLVTADNIDDKILRFELQTHTSITSTPYLNFNTLETVVTPVGRGRHYTFEMPYTPYDAANWARDNAYLIVTYQPASTHELRQIFFPLGGILPGLSYMARHCP
ncbi:MAG: hypothetical protein OXR68_01155 [Alphaproteobacteria bacterium]|nr:hypothetical protein [Alphaproteobacteria bacterium]MDD9919218.1 hypothetical protein [Alphaproteobacteria bacterium]